MSARFEPQGSEAEFLHLGRCCTPLCSLDDCQCALFVTFILSRLCPVSVRMRWVDVWEGRWARSHLLSPSGMGGEEDEKQGNL